ncbi:hypothetical protein LAJ19_08395 [Deinococcus taeanensis]|uniref:hypothetical protein n=1 Tax=Deinococcus taeanensis TaxID=2737050 RepID=UPI001CDC80E0|nr:hypothetical protein [Deinococcus taeanensis]UBV41672.1 hypothetical protein LAJ19_08395 [Deinococcus taeanensis]
MSGALTGEGGPVQVERLSGEGLTTVLAALYEAPAEAVAWMAEACSAAWVAFEVHPGEEGEVREVVLGAAGTRPSPAHGAELLGGVFATALRGPVALALADVARAEAGRVYVFAEGHLFPPEPLLQAGWREVGAYRRLEGRVPYRRVDPPEGVTLRALAEVPVPARLEALRTSEDRVGHHAVSDEAALDGAGGFDPELSVVALNPEGRGVGVCRAVIEDGEARVDAPGVHPLWRHTALRSALLAEVSARLRARGVTRLSIDSWGDTAEELAHDLGWGLHVADETPLLASP